MKLFERIFNNLANEYNIIKYTEDFTKINILSFTNSLSLPTLENFKNIVYMFPTRDDIRITIIEDEYPSATYSNKEDSEEFLENIKELDDLQEYKIEIQIIKNNYENQISVYDFDAFTKYISDLSFKGILFEFSRVLKNDYIIFRLQNENFITNSTSIYFCPENYDISKCKSERNVYKDKRLEICNFLNSVEYNVCVNDFTFNNCINADFNNVVKKIEVLLSIISICNISNIVSENNVVLILDGYTRIESNVNYLEFYNEILNQYSEIYYWIYRDGELSDKVGIARNVISLSMHDKNIIDITSSLMPSIKSAHSIYLKKNVEKYLDVKGKVTEFLHQMTQKTGEVVNGFGKSLTNNIVALVTYFFTIFITNAFGEKKFDNILTMDIFLLSIIFIVLSFIYKSYSISEINKDKERLRTTYLRFKNAYNDVLYERDLLTIFKDDEYYDEDIKFIENRIKEYSKIWNICLVIFTIGVFLLGAKPIWSFIQDIINKSNPSNYKFYCIPVLMLFRKI